MVNGEFARGRMTRGECGRCGNDVLLNTLREDGYIEGLLVCRRCWEPHYPNPIRDPIEDPVSVEQPSPCLNKIGYTVRMPNYDVANNVTNIQPMMILNLGQVTIVTT